MSDDDRTISRAELNRLNAEADRSDVVVSLLIAGREPIQVDGSVVIGREPTAAPGVGSVVLAGDQLVSKSHVRLDVTGDGLRATDLGSSNGTRVESNAGAVDLAGGIPVEIAHGARLLVGDTIITVDLQSTGVGPAIDAAPVPPIAPGVISTVPPAAAPTPASLPGPEAPPPPTTAPVAMTAPSAVPPVAAVCGSCGRSLVPGSRFCDGCGSPAAPHVANPAPGTAATSDPHAPEKAAPSSKRRILIIAGTAAAAAVVVVAGFRLLGGGDDDSARTAELERIPGTIEEQWSEDIDGADSVAGDGSNVYVVAVDGDESEIYALDRADGSEVWQTDFRREQSYAFVYGVSEGVVLARTCDFDGECVLAGFDTANGDELWDEDSDDGYLWPVDGGLLWGNSESLELFDPKTGDTSERVRGDTVRSSEGYVYARDDDEIEVFDAATLESRFGPVDVDDEASNWVFDGSNLVVAVDDELSFLDKDGDEQRTSRVGDTIQRLEVGPNGLLLVGTENEVLAVKPNDGRAEEVWSERGSMTRLVVTDVGLLIGINDDDDLDLLEASTGEVRVSFDGYYESDQWYYANAVLAEPYEDGEDSTAYDYETGDELWSDDFDGHLWVIDDAVIAVSSSDGEVTLYR